jgi:hypothetical protein
MVSARAHGLLYCRDFRVRQALAYLPDYIFDGAVLAQCADFDEAKLVGLAQERLNIGERPEYHTVFRPTRRREHARDLVLSPGDLHAVAYYVELVLIYDLARRMRAFVRDRLNVCARDRLYQ